MTELSTGWSWTCPCGWTSHRHRTLDNVERLRSGHLRFHAGQLDVNEINPARYRR